MRLIDADKLKQHFAWWHEGGEEADRQAEIFEQIIDAQPTVLPTAQPEERTNKHAETHACDYISRQAAIDIADDLRGYINVVGYWAWMERLKKLPSAQPKKGKWINAEWEHINTGEIRKGRRCSVCGCGYFRYDVSANTVADIPNYCPNCGARMEAGDARDL